MLIKIMTLDNIIKKQFYYKNPQPILNLLKKMKKMVKYLSFQSLKLQLQQSQPKQVARAVLCIKDPQPNTFDSATPNNFYKTDKYGEVTSQAKVIEWSSIVQIPFTNQEMFIIQTRCQHQYGYQMEELEALFHGQIYVKTQNFFRPLSVHVYDKNGVKCGILKYIIKVIEKQAVKTAKPKPQQSQPQPTIKLQLIGKITLYSAQLQPTAPTFKKQKYMNNFNLEVTICGKKMEAVYKKNFQWSFINGSKVEYMEDSDEQILVQLKQDGQLVLNGQIGMSGVMENRRFVTHTINMYNASQVKVAILKLDLRFITKQQLLDLMYSPTKLSKTKDQKSLPNNNIQKQKNEYQNFQKSRINSSSIIQTTRKQQINSSRINSNLNSSSQSPNLQQFQNQYRLPDRYKKVHVTNSYNQIIFSKAKRFSQPKYVNPYISYSDPNKLSDFSPDNKNGYRHVKGADISTSRKMDFTRQYKNNPGVGQYRLPSIWDKY